MHGNPSDEMLHMAIHTYGYPYGNMDIHMTIQVIYTYGYPYGNPSDEMLHMASTCLEVWPLCLKRRLMQPAPRCWEG
jgi:hypothetical protein